MLLDDDFFECLFRSSCEFRKRHIEYINCYHESFDIKCFENLMPALRKANEYVWNRSYPNNVYNSDESPLNLTRQGSYQSNDRAFYKSLQCIKYQLDETYIEEDIENLNAFNTLKSFFKIVGDIIITQHEDYKEAPWGEVETLKQLRGTK